MNRILVVLPNWYGETLFATPFLRALHQQIPTAFIATLGWPRCREVLLHSPHISELLDYDERGAHRSLAGKWQLIQVVRQRRFDTAFILRKSLSRTVMLCAAGIPRRIGFANPKSGWLLTQRIPVAGGPRHKASTYLPLLEAVGLSVLPGPYEYAVSNEERQAARQWLITQRSVDGRPLVGLQPGANWPPKRWAPERFAALGDRLTESQRVHVVITGGPADAPLADAVKHRMRHPATVVAGQTTLRQLAALLEQSHLIISHDTGVVHIAAALQRPVVALYGPTSPAATGPLGDPGRTIVLHHPDCCPQIPCYQPDSPPHPGMDSISVDEVYQAACQLLGKGSSEFGIRSSELKRSA